MNDPVSVGILGLGSYLPPQVRDNSFWDGKLTARTEEQRRSDFVVVERTTEGEAAELPPEIGETVAALPDDLFRGAKLRHVLAEDAEVSDMEAEAGRRAIADAGLAPEDIDLVLCHSGIPDVISPYNPPAVQAKIGMKNASAWSLDLGCASFHPHLVTAASLIRSGAYRRVLCVFSVAFSRTSDFHRPDSVGLGDGAAAMVIGPVPAGYGLLGHYMRTDGRLRDGVVLAPVKDGEAQRRWWSACGAPFQLSSFDVAMGKRMGVRSTTFCREACKEALARSGLRIEDVALFVCNQSLGWFVDACRRGLGLPADKTIDTFAEVANLAAVAVPLNLQRARDAGRLKDGDIVLFYSPSTGFTRAAAVYRWHA